MLLVPSRAGAPQQRPGRQPRARTHRGDPSLPLNPGLTASALLHRPCGAGPNRYICVCCPDTFSERPKLSGSPGQRPWIQLLRIGQIIQARLKSHSFPLLSQPPIDDHCLVYMTLPPTIVYLTCVFGISSAGTVRMSWESTVMSANFPGASVPLMFSSNPEYAPFRV